MAQPPPPSQFKREDYPSTGLGTGEALEGFFRTLNAHTDATRKALTGGLTLGDNGQAEFKSITINTPKTDWVPATLSAGWANLGAGFETAAYRKDCAGLVTLKGEVKTTGSPSTTALTLGAGYRPGEIVRRASSANAGAGDVFVPLTIGSDGTVSVSASAAFNGNGSLDCAFYCADFSPGVLSCFPQSVSTKVQTPKAVFLASCVDSGAGAPVPALGHPSYSLTGPGAFKLTNLPGLALGRTYTLTLLILGG